MPGCRFRAVPLTTASSMPSTCRSARLPLSCAQGKTFPAPHPSLDTTGLGRPFPDLRHLSPGSQGENRGRKWVLWLVLETRTEEADLKINLPPTP